MRENGGRGDDVGREDREGTTRRDVKENEVEQEEERKKGRRW